MSLPWPSLLPSLSSVSLAVFAAALEAQDANLPRTVPEASDHQRTSRLDDVERFLDHCVELPHGERLSIRVAGKSHAGRPLLLVRASLAEAASSATPSSASTPAPRLRALVIGNIHAGEVEGKEALQQLVREIANGEHTRLLRHVDLWLLPIYNVDGNEAEKLGNRPDQNGPDTLGQRPNAQGLDLNRDFVKADAPETRVLLELFRELDPHLFVDLHTTNGSYHGYHLTYAPSLSPNVDPAIAELSRELLEHSRRDMHKRGFETFDYGNFQTRDWDGGGAPDSPGSVRGWWTYDHRARYGVNYFGLRNRIAVLSEAYSYCDFATRIAATRSFVLSLLEQLVAMRERVAAATAAADARPTGAGKLWFGSDTVFAEAEQLPVLVSAVDVLEREGLPRRKIRRDEAEAETMAVVRRFRARHQQQLPAAWAIPSPSVEVVQRLRLHGVRFAAITAATEVSAQRFEVHKKRKPKRPYQGHQALVLEGTWLSAADLQLELGTIVIPADQPLARLAATLLEPLGEDSLSTWNFFEARTDAFYPVLRLHTVPR